jgi:hypothetical protein
MRIKIYSGAALLYNYGKYRMIWALETLWKCIDRSKGGYFMCNWIRAELKQRAKSVLKQSYWKAFLAALAISFTGGGPNINMRYNFNSHNFSLQNFYQQNFNINQGISTGSPQVDSFPGFGGLFEAAPVLLTIFGIIMVVAILVAVAFGIFLTGPMEVSGRKYYVNAATGEVNLGNIGYCFEKGRYLPIVKTMFFKNLYNFLWGLLLIIPGIVKSYSYRMVPYLLTDNPFLETERAITLSRELMDGNKFNTFVLDLSFIGWYILGMIPFGIGVLFVNPYAFSTSAELYLVIREYGLQSGICTYEELNLKRPVPPDAEAPTVLLTQSE